MPGEPFKAWFEGRDRVYLPYEEDLSESESELRSRHPEVVSAISYMGYDPEEASLSKKYLYPNARSLKNSLIGEKFFKKVIERKIPEMAEECEISIKPNNFAKNLAEISWRSDFNQKASNILDDFFNYNKEQDLLDFEIKITELVSKFKKYDSDDLKYGSKSKADKLVVITKDYDDVLHMSTDRRWTSCLNIHDGSRSESAYCEVENGGFVAYLIESDDRQIKNPISRIWVRRLDGQVTGKSIALMEDEIYGQDDLHFYKIVEDWIKSKQGDIASDVYNLMGGEYSDTYRSSIIRSDSLKDINELIQNPEEFFQYPEKIYVVEDKAIFSSILENPRLKDYLNIKDSEKKKIFKSKNEMDFYINYTNDISKKNLSNIIYQFGVDRCFDESGWAKWENKFIDEEGQYRGDVSDGFDADSFVDDLEQSGSYDEYNEEDVDENGNIIGTKNIFNLYEPYYSYEKSIKDMVEGKKERFEVEEVQTKEYFEKIKEYSPKIFDTIVRKVLKSKPGSINSESINILKKMYGGETPSFQSMAAKHPDSLTDESFDKILNESINILEESIQEIFDLNKKHSVTINEKNTKDALSYDVDRVISRFKTNIEAQRLSSIVFSSNIESRNKDLSKKISGILNKIIDSDLRFEEKISSFYGVLSSISVPNYYGASKINLELDEKVSNFIMNLLKTDDSKKMSYAKTIVGYFIQTRNISEENILKIINNLNTVRLPYDYFNPEGITKTAIILYVTPEGVLSSKPIMLENKIFLEISKDNKNLEQVGEMLENALISLRKKIKEEIDTYKRESDEIKNDPDSFTEDYFSSPEEELRFMLKNFNSKISSLRKFAEEIIAIIKD